MVPPNNSALGWGGSCRAIGIRPAHAHDGSRRSRRLPALCHSKGPKQHLPARRKFVPNTVPWSTAMSSIPALFPCQQARSVPFWLCIRKALAVGTKKNRPLFRYVLLLAIHHTQTDPFLPLGPGAPESSADVFSFAFPPHSMV